MTSISDRCKTAREGATPGPWRVGEAHEGIIGPRDYDEVLIASTERRGPMYLTYDAPILEGDNLKEDLSLAALAPESADEVVRLTDALEALAEWHDNEAELTEHPGGAITRMELCNTHRHAAARIRRILNGEGDHP